MPNCTVAESVLEVGAEALVKTLAIFVVNSDKMEEDGDSPELESLSAMEIGEKRSEWRSEYQ